jgi:hypothetical protein
MRNARPDQKDPKRVVGALLMQVEKQRVGVAVTVFQTLTCFNKTLELLKKDLKMIKNG